MQKTTIIKSLWLFLKENYIAIVYEWRTCFPCQTVKKSTQFSCSTRTTAFLLDHSACAWSGIIKETIKCDFSIWGPIYDGPYLFCLLCFYYKYYSLFFFPKYRVLTRNKKKTQYISPEKKTILMHEKIIMLWFSFGEFEQDCPK